MKNRIRRQAKAIARILASEPARLTGDFILMAALSYIATML